MSSEQLETERRRGRIAGFAGLLGLVIFFASLLLGGSEYNGAEGIADQIAAFDADRGAILAQQLLQALGIALFALPLAALFLAASDRSDAVRRGLLGTTLAGPLFLAGSLIALYFALDATVEPFLNGAGVDPSSDDDAGDVLRDQTAYSIYGGLDFAGRLGLVFAMVYTSLQAMRAGLMTRFWGTLGMALGAALLIVGVQTLLVFALAASLLVADLWPGGRPPAWEAGRAIPWLKPGEALAGGGADPEVDPDEPADPDDFEPSGATALSERPARRDNRRKRKRKQRS